MNIGEKIFQAMKEKGFSQIDLSKRIGINRSMISKYINGANNPSIKTLKKIADVLDKPLSWFYGEETFLEERMETIARRQAELAIKETKQIYKSPQKKFVNFLSFPVWEFGPHKNSNSYKQNKIEEIQLNMEEAKKIDLVLKLKGTSFKKRGILEEDYLFVKKQSTVKDGQIIVAFINNKGILLSTPLPGKIQNIKIIGIVKRIYRKYNN